MIGAPASARSPNASNILWRTASSSWRNPPGLNTWSPSTTTALKIADYVVTEAGFGADLGAEKFMNLKMKWRWRREWTSFFSSSTFLWGRLTAIIFAGITSLITCTQYNCWGKNHRDGWFHKWFLFFEINYFLLSYKLNTRIIIKLEKLVCQTRYLKEYRSRKINQYCK